MQCVTAHLILVEYLFERLILHVVILVGCNHADHTDSRSPHRSSQDTLPLEGFDEGWHLQNQYHLVFDNIHLAKECRPIEDTSQDLHLFAQLVVIRVLDLDLNIGLIVDRILLYYLTITSDYFFVQLEMLLMGVRWNNGVTNFIKKSITILFLK